MDYSDRSWKDYSSSDRETIYGQWERGLITMAQMPQGSLHIDPTGIRYVLGHRITDALVSMLPESSLVLVPSKSSPSLELESLSPAERKKAMAETLEQSRAKFVASAPKSIEVLEAIRDDTGAPDAVRLKAASDLLDRAGLKAGVEISLEIEHKISPSEIIMSKLEEIVRRSQPPVQEIEQFYVIDEDGNEVKD